MSYFHSGVGGSWKTLMSHTGYTQKRSIKADNKNIQKEDPPTLVALRVGYTFGKYCNPSCGAFLDNVIVCQLCFYLVNRCGKVGSSIHPSHPPSLEIEAGAAGQMVGLLQWRIHPTFGCRVLYLSGKLLSFTRGASKMMASVMFFKSTTLWKKYHIEKGLIKTSAWIICGQHVRLLL